MRCLFSHPELLKGTRLHQVRVLDCPVHLMKFGQLNSWIEYPATDNTELWGIPLVAGRARCPHRADIAALNELT